MDSQVYIPGFEPETKDHMISKALNVLSGNHIKAELKDFQNGHIQAVAHSGLKLNYYATTGTIAGYPNLSGLDDFVKLCTSKAGDLTW